jgi:hypothetical protein
MTYGPERFRFGSSTVLSGALLARAESNAGFAATVESIRLTVGSPISFMFR